MGRSIELHRADISLDRDNFMRSLIRELAGTLEDVIGVEDASGYISIVGAAIGKEIDKSYCKALQVEKLSRSQVADVLVDLKQRIEGKFYVIEQNDQRIVFGNSQCPFGDKVIDRPSMCMMTSNVFGHIAAEHLGYAKVELQRTIAERHGECIIVVHLRPDETKNIGGREYFKST